MSRSTVFVGNIPYDVKEAELRDVFERVAPVHSFRFVTDKETGKPRGFGFCEFQTEAHAQLAIDTLNNYEINGRHIKVDSADGNQDGSGSGPRGGRQQKDIEKALDKLGMPQVFDVVKNFKDLIQQDLPKAKRLLEQNPVLGVALLKAHSMLDALHPKHLREPVPTPLTPLNPPPVQQFPPPAQHMRRLGGRPPPVPAVAPVRPRPQQPGPGVDPQNQQLIKEIMQLTPQQIESLPPQERENVLQILQQLNMSGQLRNQLA